MNPRQKFLLILAATGFAAIGIITTQVRQTDAPPPDPASALPWLAAPW